MMTPSLTSTASRADSKFKFYVEALLLGKKIAGVSYSQQEINGENMFVFDISLDDGRWLAIATKEPPTFFMDKIGPGATAEPQRTM